MPQIVAEKLEEAKRALSTLTLAELTICAVIGIGVLLLLLILWRFLRRRRRRELTPPVSDLDIDVESLGDTGPPAEPPFLEHYNVPVRLVAVVLAPTDHVRQLPPVDALAELVDHIVPGLAKVLAAHRPLIRRWPSQLSGEGFAHTFFAHAKLPGDHGKGTPWCSVAGRFKIERQSLMAGLLMRSDGNNNFSRSIIHEEHEWLSVLRVKSD